MVCEGYLKMETKDKSILKKREGYKKPWLAKGNLSGNRCGSRAGVEAPAPEALPVEPWLECSADI